MKFYNREKELAALEKVRQTAFSNHSQMMVLTGRRRIGKTSLIFKSCEGTPTVYLFVSRSNEADLCMRFTSEVRQSLDVYVPDFTSFSGMFRFLMHVGPVSQGKSCEPDCQRLGLYAYEPDFQGCERTFVWSCGQHHEAIPLHDSRAERNTGGP